MSHICIIEDDTAIAEIERDYLEINGFTVSIATDGVSGLNLAQTESFDLILLDLMLPQLDGFTLPKTTGTVRHSDSDGNGKERGHRQNPWAGIGGR